MLPRCCKPRYNCFVDVDEETHGPKLCIRFDSCCFCPRLKTHYKDEHSKEIVRKIFNNDNIIIIRLCNNRRLKGILNWTVENRRLMDDTVFMFWLQDGRRPQGKMENDPTKQKSQMALNVAFKRHVDKGPYIEIEVRPALVDCFQW